jgi:hypothetical protein
MVLSHGPTNLIVACLPMVRNKLTSLGINGACVRARREIHPSEGMVSCATSHVKHSLDTRVVHEGVEGTIREQNIVIRLESRSVVFVWFPCGIQYLRQREYVEFKV